MILDEQFSALMLAAIIVTIAGIYVVNRGYYRQKMLRAQY
jgi:hypothetical protein